MTEDYTPPLIATAEPFNGPPEGCGIAEFVAGPTMAVASVRHGEAAERIAALEASVEKLRERLRHQTRATQTIGDETHQRVLDALARANVTPPCDPLGHPIEQVVGCTVAHLGGRIAALEAEIAKLRAEYAALACEIHCCQRVDLNESHADTLTELRRIIFEALEIRLIKKRGTPA